MQPLQPVSGSDLQTFLSTPEQLLQQSVVLQLAIASLARREFIGATPDRRSIIPPTTHDNILGSLAYNPSLTPQLLSILVQDPCVEVRLYLERRCGYS